MIYIVDNGGRYDDHDVLFLESGWSFAEVTSVLLALPKRSDLAYCIVGRANEIAWQGDALSQDLMEYAWKLGGLSTKCGGVISPGITERLRAWTRVPIKLVDEILNKYATPEQAKRIRDAMWEVTMEASEESWR